MIAEEEESFKLTNYSPEDMAILDHWQTQLFNK